MSWTVKRGNTSIMDIPIYEKDGVTLVSNLADVTSVEFAVKEKKTDTTPKINLGYLISGLSGIEINTPDPGYLRITVSSVDSAITPATYVFAIEAIWPGDPPDVREVILEVDGVETHDFIVEQDIIQ